MTDQMPDSTNQFGSLEVTEDVENSKCIEIIVRGEKDDEIYQMFVEVDDQAGDTIDYLKSIVNAVWSGNNTFVASEDGLTVLMRNVIKKLEDSGFKVVDIDGTQLAPEHNFRFFVPDIEKRLPLVVITAHGEALDEPGSFCHQIDLAPSGASDVTESISITITCYSMSLSRQIADIINKVGDGDETQVDATHY